MRISDWSSYVCSSDLLAKMTLVFCAPAYIVVSGRHGNNLRIAGDFYVNVVEFGLLPVVEAWSVSTINFAGVDFDIGSDLRGDLSKTAANLYLPGCDHLMGRVTECI